MKLIIEYFLCRLYLSLFYCFYVLISTAVVLVEGPNVRLYLFAILGAVFMCAVMAVIMYVICRKPGLSHIQ